MKDVGRWVVLLSGVGVVLGCHAEAGDGGGGGDGGAPEGLGGSSGAAPGGGTGGEAPDAVSEILREPAVVSALDEAREAGVDVMTHTEKEPADPTGYYSYALRAGTWVASGNGANVGAATTAAELRVDLGPDASVDTAMVGSFDGTTPASSAIERGYILRGIGNEVTLYARRSAECNLSGSSYSLSQVYIWSGTLEQGTGNWLDQRQLTVTVSAEGELTSDCQGALVGNVEVVGGWAVAAIPIATKVSVDDLGLMCVEGNRGYVPTELWTGTERTACECTTDFEVSCDLP